MLKSVGAEQHGSRAGSGSWHLGDECSQQVSTHRGGAHSLAGVPAPCPEHPAATFLRCPHILMLFLLHQLATSSTTSEGVSGPRPEGYREEQGSWDGNASQEMEPNQEHGRAEGHPGAGLGAGILEAESWRQPPSVPMKCSSCFPAPGLFVTGSHRSSPDTRDHVNTALSATIPWERLWCWRQSLRGQGRPSRS